jgi:hypothetical protein
MELARFLFCKEKYAPHMTFLGRDLGTLRLSTNQENPRRLA